MAKKETENTKTRKYYIHLIISLCIMLFFRFIPNFGQMTNLGMELLGIIIGALWGWVNCDLIFPSVMAMILVGFTDAFDNVPAVFTAAISNPTIQLIIWILIFSAILTASGICNQMAQRIMSSKIIKGRPWLLTVFIYAVSLLIAAFGMGLAGTILMWEFIYSVSKQVGYTNKDTWPKMMIVGTVVSSLAGVVIMPYTVGVVATFGYLAGSGGDASYNFGTYLLFMVILNVIIGALYLLFVKVFVRPDMSKLKTSVELGEKIPFTSQQKVAAIALLAMIVLLIAPSILPAGSLKNFLNTIGMTPTIVLITALVTIPRTKEGKPLFTFQQLGASGMIYGPTFMVATAVIVGSNLATGETGFVSSVMALFAPVLAGKSPYVFTAIILIFALLLTNVINNAIAGAVMIPVMYGYAVSVGANPLVIAALMALVTDMGMLLPCACPVAAVMHGNKEWLTTKDIMIFSLIGLLAVAITVLVIGIPLGNMMIIPA